MEKSILVLSHSAEGLPAYHSPYLNDLTRKSRHLLILGPSIQFILLFAHKIFFHYLVYTVLLNLCILYPNFIHDWCCLRKPVYWNIQLLFLDFDSYNSVRTNLNIFSWENWPFSYFSASRQGRDLFLRDNSDFSALR